jgi:cytochrome P450
MTPHPTEQEDWDPREPAVLKDQIAAYDAMRRRCPVAHSEYLHWSVFAHRDVLRIVQDAQAFSNVVSAHVSIPNGMDPPAHTAWRALIEPYFAQPVLDAFAPRAAAIARDRMLALPASGDGDVDVEWMGAFSEPCAVRLLCAYMGWSDELHEPLRQWARRNQAATLTGDREATAAMAFEFDGHIGAQLAARRAAGGPAQDLTARLLGETVDGRPLRDDEIVSIIRNWTVGELSTLAASIGIHTEYLARHPGLQQRLRQEPQLLAPAIDEILRIPPALDRQPARGAPGGAAAGARHRRRGPPERDLGFGQPRRNRLRRAR